jgi:hypothetical protein
MWRPLVERSSYQEKWKFIHLFARYYRTTHTDKMIGQRRRLIIAQTVKTLDYCERASFNSYYESWRWDLRDKHSTDMPQIETVNVYRRLTYPAPCQQHVTRTTSLFATQHCTVFSSNGYSPLFFWEKQRNTQLFFGIACTIQQVTRNCARKY